MEHAHKPQPGKRVKKSSAAPQAPEPILLPEFLSDPEAIDPARQKKIERIKKAVADGTYRISKEDLADKLIEHMREPKR